MDVMRRPICRVEDDDVIGRVVEEQVAGVGIGVKERVSLGGEDGGGDEEGGELRCQAPALERVEVRR